VFFLVSAELVLKEFLPSSEARVYLAMLGLGSASANDISKRTGLHRANVYDCLDALHQKGLITIVLKAGKKHFEAVEPERLMTLLEQKKLSIDAIENSLSDALPDLKQRFEHRKSKQLIHHLVGIEGLRTIGEEMIKEGAKTKVLYTINSAGNFRKNLGLYTVKWNKRRLEEKITLKAISPEFRRQAVSQQLEETRYLPNEFSSPLTIEILGEKVGLLLYEEQPLAVLIESKIIADAFKKQFDMLWKIAKP
jgi:sugar-specific transcriptional regulator TrmB